MIEERLQTTPHSHQNGVDGMSARSSRGCFLDAAGLHYLYDASDVHVMRIRVASVRISSLGYNSIGQHSTNGPRDRGCVGGSRNKFVFQTEGGW
jgi:hypothetical protein